MNDGYQRSHYNTRGVVYERSMMVKTKLLHQVLCLLLLHHFLGHDLEYLPPLLRHEKNHNISISMFYSIKVISSEKLSLEEILPLTGIRPYTQRSFP